MIVIVVIFAAAISGVTVLLLLAPLRGVVNVTFKEFRPAGWCRFSFFHPLLFAAEVDFATRGFVVRFLGRRIGGKRKPSAESAPSTVAHVSDHAERDDAGATFTTRSGSTGDTPAGGPHHDPGQSFRQTGEEAADPTPAAPTPSPRSADGTSSGAPGAGGAVEMVVQSAPPEEQLRSEQRPVSSSHPVKIKREFTESMALRPEKKDNWFKRLQRNRYLFFIGNGAWRAKAVQWILRVARTLFSIVRFDRFQASVRAGVEDPMLTGTIAGLHRAAVYGLTMRQPYIISFEPVFMTNHFEFSVVLRAGTSLSRLLVPIVVAIVTFPAMHTLWLVWRLYRIEKRRNRMAAA
ncbi:MAG: DUF2953 domain-containing protein [Chitinispirillaceae bacterium]|nr:DUF2953 domain-containing protein [Chitinispirillaceae bacterium]